MVAQVMHLPYLHSLPHLFKVEAICDLSAETAARLARLYDIPGVYQNTGLMLAEANLDAVLVLTPFHFPHVMQALQAGKHVFVEKPLCENPRQAVEVMKTARSRNLIGQVGYHKPHDAGFELGAQMARSIPDVRMATMRIAHGPNEPFLQHHSVIRSDDIDPELAAEAGTGMRRAMAEAIGEQPPHLARAYGGLLGGGCHQLSIMRGCLGRVQRVLSTEVWNDGGAISSILEFDDQVRCVFSSVFMPNIRLFDEVFTAYGDNESVSIHFPSPFLKHAATTVRRRRMVKGRFEDAEFTSDYTEAFRNELVHFHESIVEGRPVRTPLEHGAEDVEVMIEMIRKSPDSQGSAPDRDFSDAGRGVSPAEEEARQP